MDMERRGDDTIQWAVEFLRDKISEEEIHSLQAAMIAQRIDGEALLLMSAFDMHNVLQLAFGVAVKLRKARLWVLLAEAWFRLLRTQIQPDVFVVHL